MKEINRWYASAFQQPELLTLCEGLGCGLGECLGIVSVLNLGKCLGHCLGIAGGEASTERILDLSCGGCLGARLRASSCMHQTVPFMKTLSFNGLGLPRHGDLGSP